jgi:hypothetical protein
MKPTVEIPRDYRNRPLIIPPGGGKPVPYKRASNYSKIIEDTHNLQVWRGNVVALGVARDRAVLHELSAITSTDPDPLRNKETKVIVKSLSERAFEAGGGRVASSAGTALHKLTEYLDEGHEPEYVPSELQRPLEAYRWGTTGLTVEAIELFVVVDDIKVAGTLDRLVRLPDGRVVVADIKSGNSDPSYAAGVTSQVSTYARGLRYDPATGERSPLHPDLDPEVGLMIHVPIFPPDGVIRCDLYQLDLKRGWERVLLASQVHALKSIPKPKKLVLS